ncbi:MAG: nitronate monooxygenase family protein [bacterium]
MELKNLNKYWEKGTHFLQTRYAILCGAMTWVSEPYLVSAVSNHGCFGVLAGANMPPEILDKEIDNTRKLTQNPFGVNLITIAPNFEKHVDLVIQKKVEYVIFAGTIPPDKAIARVKEKGAKLICFASTLTLAKRLIKLGADALIIEGNEAGGHIGPVSTSVLAQEILLGIEKVPVFVAGGIGTGEMMAIYLMMGASGCQLGSRFVVAEECLAHLNFKKMFVRSSARDAQPTYQFDPFLPVVPVRAIVNEATRKFNSLQLSLLKELEEGKVDRKTAQMKLEEFWIGSLRKAVVDGDVENGSVMAGQSVGFIKKNQPVEEIIQDLVEGAERQLSLHHGY